MTVEISASAGVSDAFITTMLLRGLEGFSPLPGTDLVINAPPVVSRTIGTTAARLMCVAYVIALTSQCNVFVDDGTHSWL